MEQLCTKASFEGLDMPGNSRAMHPERARGIAECSKPRDLGSGV